MKKIILNQTQSAEMEPMVRDAYMTGGTVFCQCRRLAFPDNDKLAVTCHLVPAESSQRLKAWLDKEAARIARKGASKAVEQEAAV